MLTPRLAASLFSRRTASHPPSLAIARNSAQTYHPLKIFFAEPSPEEISELLVAWCTGERKALDHLSVEEAADVLNISP